jgi:hypothetical protein
MMAMLIMVPQSTTYLEIYNEDDGNVDNAAPSCQAIYLKKQKENTVISTIRRTVL